MPRAAIQPDGLTHKERIAVRHYLQSGSKRGAVLEAYDVAPSNADTLAQQVFRRSRVRAALARSLGQQIGSEGLKDRLTQLLDNPATPPATKLAALKTAYEWMDCPCECPACGFDLSGEPENPEPDPIPYLRVALELIRGGHLANKERTGQLIGELAAAFEETA